MAEQNNVTVNGTNGAENNQQATVQEQQTNNAPQPQGEMPRGETPKEVKTTSVEMPIWVAKALGITKKVLKYALPVGIAAGSVFLGIQLGKSEESKRSSGEIGDLQSKLDRANADIALLEAKANAIPELPQIEAPSLPDVTELPSLNLETGEF